MIINVPQSIVLTFDPAQLQTILAALEEMPYKRANPVLVSIQKQLSGLAPKTGKGGETPLNPRDALKEDRSALVDNPS